MERERRQYEDTIHDLRRRLDMSEEERRKTTTQLTALLEDQRQKAEKAAEPKELFLVKGAGHVDLYDRVKIIPFEKLTAFFTRSFAQAESDQ